MPRELWLRLARLAQPYRWRFAAAAVFAAFGAWPSLFPPSVALVLCGLGGLAYGTVVIHRARRQTFYKPLWEDWVFYALLPCSIYAALALTALFLRATPQLALFVIGAAALGLLLVGTHNAWDTVTHVLVGSSRRDATKTE